jgi:death-on-curing protein
MSRRHYPSVAEAIGIHEQLIREFGGGGGLRDRGRLEAAIIRPQLGYYDDLVDEAAALMESLAINHAFVDGNKRLSFAVTDVFLRLNGHYLDVESGSGYRFIAGALSRGEFRFALIRDWIAGHLKNLAD